MHNYTYFFKDVSIVGVPDQVYGQKVAAVIVVDTSDFDLQQLRYLEISRDRGDNGLFSTLVSKVLQ